MTSYLNTENIARNKDGVEYHPLKPFLPENAKVLFLGSFPPQRKRWCMDFYYPNFINDHWRIEGQIFFGDKNHFVDLEAKRFKIDEIIAYISQFFTLKTGDILYTGTPVGVGPVNIDDHLEGYLEGRKVLEFNCK